jgi:hypothetical protein
MAARENQGLTIALIVFVMLTILLTVSTYMLFDRYQDQLKTAKTAQKSAETATQEKSKADKDREELLAVIGAAPTDTADVVSADIKADLAKYLAVANVQLDDKDRTLKRVIASLNDVVKKSYEDVDSRKRDLDQVKAQLAAAQDKAAAKQKELEAARDAANVALDEQTKKYNAAIDGQKTTADQLAKDKNDTNAAKDKLKADYERKLTALNAQLVASQREVVQLKEHLNVYSKLTPATSGGKILWVNQRENTVYINLGSDDHLQRRISFSVYPPGTNDVTKTPAKGKVEVINITGPHAAEARIIENPLADPILPGDWIHTEGWQPGQRQHFAIGGFINLDGTGVDQTAKLRDLITANGGIVDADLNDKGKVTGAITVNTRYLILGEMKADTPAAAQRIGGTTNLLTDAKRLNVEQIGLDKFLDMMGYTSNTAGATGAKAPDKGDFRPRTPSGAAPSTAPGGNYYKFGS